NKMHQTYASEFIKHIEMNDNLFYADRVEQDEMMTLNKYAKVSVLASWFETTGLAGLEGGIMGCNVVITKKGYTREYYKDYAWYCDPENTSSIRNAIMSAYSAPRDSKRLREHIYKMKLTWKNSAEGTLNVYRRLLKG
ncbi:MAG: glycosyltransferase, partial [Elusimicrobia bacterium]|nr:glycosyltransferase [Elusimicrobiota bacterium]